MANFRGVMKVVLVAILLGLVGFLGYGIWTESRGSSDEVLFLNPDYFSSSEEIITWKPLESSLNVSEIPHWSEISKAKGADLILVRINSLLSELGLKEELEIQIILSSGASSFFINGDEKEVLKLAKGYFDAKEIEPGSFLKFGENVGIYSGSGAVISSTSAELELLTKKDENASEAEKRTALDEDLSWFSRSNAKKWFAVNEISADGSATIHFKKRKGFVYAYAFMQDSLMVDQSLDVTYSIWDFKLPGTVSAFTIEEFPIRKLDAESVQDVEEICQCDVRTAWKSWNSNQVYLFEQNGIQFYGLQCLTDLPALTGLYPFIDDKAEMYKGYQLQTLISGAEVGGLYADMFGREVSLFLDLEEQVFFFSSKSEAKTFINGIQNSEFNYLADQNLRELLLLSPSYTSYNSSAPKNEPVVYQFEKQNKGRYYHALWKVEDGAFEEMAASEPESEENDGTPKTLWETQLGAKVIGSPFAFTNHYTKETEVAILTEDNKVSLLNAKGEKLWVYEVDEPVLGELHEVDLYRNNKFQLVFSTASKLYALDRNGKNVENFPVQLKGKASAPVSVMDYDGKRKYRLLVPLRDGNVKNYDKDGKEVNGWKHKAESSPVISQVQHVQISRKDYLICAKENNKIAIYKRDGKLRYTQDLSLSNYNGKPISLEKSNKIEDVRLVYEDKSGNIVQVKLSLDNNEAEIVGIASSENSLLKNMVDGSDSDFLLSKGPRLALYNEKLELKFSTDFDADITSDLEYSVHGKKKYIGLCEGSNIHVLNLRGETLSGFPLYGQGNPVLINLKQNGGLSVVTSDTQGLVICYKVGV